MPSNSTPLVFDATSLPPENRIDTVLKKLKRDTHIMSQMQPRLSELTRLYQARKSRIDQFVEWYADNPLWKKIMIGTAVVSASYTVGFLIGMTWFLTGLITGLYVTAISIMEEHAEMMRQRNTSFADDIKKMEATIAESINEFRLLEEQLNDVFNSLGTLHEQRSEDITRLKGEVDTIEAHNLRYVLIIEALEESSRKLEASQGEVSLTETEIKALSAEFQHSLQEAKSLCDVLSTVVSVAEPVIVSERTEEANHSDSNASFIEETDAFISSAQQRLNKLRQSRNASKVFENRVSEASVVSTALYNFT
jgi:ElaB/YqjD/DUF883 family membrane-anchored ribosome-binding protein